MSQNTSATGGYLSPQPETDPAEDVALEDQLQAIVAGITGIPGHLVRPRWQPVPPKQPSVDTDWCAIGIVRITPDDNAVIAHQPAGEGTDALQRHETIEVLASFYGPGGYRGAARLRDGFPVAQNREAMFLIGMGFIDTDAIVSAPDLVNQQWLRRADLAFRLRRRIDRTYPVLHLLSAAGTIRGEDGRTQPFRTGE